MNLSNVANARVSVRTRSPVLVVLVVILVRDMWMNYSVVNGNIYS